MTAFLSLLVGLFVTMVLIPPLERVSGLLRLVDQPNQRKVHAKPIPRVGGIAIYVGILVPILVWVPIDTTALHFLVGGALLVLLGISDDRYALDFRWKLIGQSLAVIVVMLGGVHFERLPFCGLDPLSPWITYPISFLFLLGVTNALNLSDGLDGLAGGCAMLSLAGLGLLAYAAEGPLLYFGAAALIGAILGFLRFNTYPAVVFLGDAGSMFLGFALATSAVVLTKDVNPALNPVLPLFLIGLPILDTLCVIVLRLRRGLSPFSADNRHMHHRLLALGFLHHEAVSVIYTVQAAMVTLGLLTRYQSDGLVAALFLLFSVSVFGLLYAAEAVGWRVRAAQPARGAAGEAPPFVERRNLTFRRWPWLPMAMAHCVQVGVAVFLLFAAVFVGTPPRDIAIVALSVAGMMVFAHFFLHPWTRVFTRIGVYLLGLLTVFLVAPLTSADSWLDWAVNVYLIVLCCWLGLAIRLTRRDTFQMTPQDLLALFFVLAVPNLPFEGVADYPVGSMALRAAVVFYACEYVLSRDRLSFLSLRIAGFLGLVILGFRGLL